MAYVQWPPLPAFKSVVASNDVYLNVATPLTVIGSGGGGGTAPGNVPVPVAGTITSTSIEITFDVASVTGTQPITYEALYSDTPGGFFVPVLSPPPVGSVYTGTATGLTPNTPYYFKVRATNTVGFTESTESEITTAAGGGTPPGNVPNAQLLNATSSIITTYIDISGVTGDAPITYFSHYGLVPGTFTALSGYSLSTGSIYVTSTINVGASTTWYFETRAQNSAGFTSTIAPYPAFSTLTAATGPNVAPSVPVASLISPSSMTVTFNTSSVTGSPTPTYLLGFGTTDPPLTLVSTVSVGSEASVIISSLTANSIYYTNSIAFIDDSHVSSSVVAAVSTLSGVIGPNVAPSIPVASAIGGSSMTVTFNTSSVTGTPTPTYLLYFDTVNPPTPFYSTISVGPEASVQFSTLTQGTVYYAGSIAFIDPLNLSTSAVTAFSTLAQPSGLHAPQPSLANNGGLMSTLYFDTANVIGEPPITYDMFWNVNGAAPFFSTTATLSTGTTIYSAVINDLPTNNGTFQIYSRASNVVGITNSDNTAITGSTIASVVTATPSTMTIGVGGVSPTVISLSTNVIFNGNPQPEIVSQFGTVSSSLISTTGNFNLTLYAPSVISSISGLPGSTIFYFNSLAYNVFGSTINTEITAISTLSS
jgi:hypothetical protein